MGAKSKRGPASAPAQPSEAWRAWQAAVKALRQHEHECQACTVSWYCEKGRSLNIAEVTAHRAVTHPGEAV